MSKMRDTKYRYGFTGTLSGTQTHKWVLEGLFGPSYKVTKTSELQAKGLLAKCQIEILQMWDYVDYKNYREEQTHLVTKQARIDYIGRMVEQMRQTGNTLVLVDRVKSGELLTEVIPESVFVRGATKADERKEHYDEVRISDDKVIVATYGVAAVGINLPRIFNLVLIEPGKSFVRVIQSIGRGMRKA